MRPSKCFLIFGTLVTLSVLALFVTGCQHTSTSSNHDATISDKDHGHADTAEPGPDANHDNAPTAAPQGEKQTLYLMPGGAYTEADIAANGNTIPAEKFAGFISNHNLEPSPGDRICPITLTKANSQISWIVGGKKYLFCCPPCIDEFVAKAKTKPEELKDPETYVK